VGFDGDWRKRHTDRLAAVSRDGSGASAALQGGRLEPWEQKHPGAQGIRLAVGRSERLDDRGREILNGRTRAPRQYIRVVDRQPSIAGLMPARRGAVAPEPRIWIGSAWLQDTACGIFGQNGPTRRLASVGGLDRCGSLGRIRSTETRHRVEQVGRCVFNRRAKQTPLRKLGHDEMFHANRGQLVDSRRGLARLADSILGPYLA
jgi:hypothetical protein